MYYLPSLNSHINDEVAKEVAKSLTEGKAEERLIKKVPLYFDG